MLFLVAVDSGDFFYTTRFQIPYMEVPSPTGSEYSLAVGMENSGVYGRAAEMERGSRGVDFAVNMMKANGRVETGGEEQRVRRVEG